MKAIETHYKGYRFRSRLEARWAVFLDAVGVAYDYEKEGFDLDGLYYLPDFWVPGVGWIEIKPNEELSDEESEKARRFQRLLWAMRCADPDALWSDLYYILCGTPWLDRYSIFSVWQHAGDNSLEICKRDDRWTDCPLCGRVNIALTWDGYSTEADGQTWDGLSCMNCDCGERDHRHPRVAGTYFHKGIVTCPPGAAVSSLRLTAAYRAARSARFEHGESPQITET